MDDIKPPPNIVEDPMGFVKREKHSEDTVDSLLDFFIEFIKEVLGEKFDLSDMEDSRSSEN